jgi:hypothetical protein
MISTFLLVIKEGHFIKTETFNIYCSHKNVDIKFSAHDAFLEYFSLLHVSS